MEEAIRMILSHLNSNKSIWFWGVHPLKAPSTNIYNSREALNLEVIMKKLTGNKSALIDTMYIGEYATYIYTFDGETSGNIYQCNGTQLDDEGKLMALKLKCDGYEIDDRTMSL